MTRWISQLAHIRRVIQLQSHYKCKYAFIGYGSHATTNLYTVLNYLNVNLKYIVTSSKSTAEQIQKKLPHIILLHDIERVLNDQEIKGVFIATPPDSHFNLICKFLSKNKCVFTEKPPCNTIDEFQTLIALEKQSAGFVLVGLQKRYAPIIQNIKRKIEKCSYYKYSFLTGHYPEGNPLTDLFIHPIDVVTYLFGTATIHKLKEIKVNGSQTLLLSLSHANGCCGFMELSTDYLWSQAQEHLFINMPHYILEAKNADKLLCIKKSKKILDIPIEKLFSSVVKEEILYQTNNFLPIKSMNNLYTTGFYHELKTFLNLCENHKDINLTSLEQLQDTYQFITQIQKNV